MSYSRLEEKDSHPNAASDDGESSEFLLSHELHNKQTHTSRSQTLLRLLGTATLCLVFLTIGVLIGTRIIDRDALCTLRVAQDSPLLNDVPLTYSVQRFNGSLFKENVFRRQGSPEVDAAWELLGVNYNSVSIPERYAEQAGFRPDQVKIKQKYGGGYPANVEGLHHLHCLNLVRQSLYYNYDYYKQMGKGAFINSDRVVQAHVSHCLDIVRQQLMCTVDVGFLGQVWTDPKFPSPFVDFNTAHKCRNFEAIRQWAKEHQLPSTDDLEEDFLEPPKIGDTIYAETP